MLLKKRIPASGIAEVVIALAVIATCIGVSALIFTRSIKSTTSFEDIRIQTELQSAIWNHFQTGIEMKEPEGVVVESEIEDEEKTRLKTRFIAPDEKCIWEQQLLKDE